METEDPEAWEGHIFIPDEDSGSTYEEESEEGEVHGSSQSNEPKARSSRANSAVERGRSKNRRGSAPGSSHSQDALDSDSGGSRDSSTASQREERLRNAREWAANFQAPQSPTDIRSPVRKAPGTRSKRKAVISPSELRAKRLKSWYNNDYRELLNVEIHNAAERSIADDQVPVEASQIGCSVWAAREKDAFFSALSRLGRDNVREIASRIGSKSEPEVQEYIHLLHKGLLETSHKLLDLVDLPAAIEITDECCSLLERAGEALNSRQERFEEEMEQEKWDDLWLINQAVSKRLERQRMDEAAKKILGETFHGANLLHLKNWLELSRRIFMNSETAEDNWEIIAESDETPAIRATAFEDFHSLAVSITKRLVSATLFCTMSRQRARGARAIKHADINLDDVEAAVRIIGLKSNTHEFWRGCARRCNLKVFDEEWNSFMSYGEVETALRETKERSLSRSVSRQRSVSRAHSEGEIDVSTDSPSFSEDYESEDSLRSHESDFTKNGSESGNSHRAKEDEFSSLSRKERLRERARAAKETDREHEEYVEAFDQEASRGEERRLWMFLRQTSPFDLKAEPRELPEQPKGVFRDDLAEATNWRDHLHYRAQWDTLNTPVPRENFERNRKRISRKAKRRMEKARSGRDLTIEGSEGDEDGTSSVESDEEREEHYENAEEQLGEGEDNQKNEDQGVSHPAAIESEEETDQSENGQQNKETELRGRQTGSGNEDSDISDVAKEQSPMSVDAALGFLRRDFGERQGSDEGLHIKDEYESDS